MIFVTQVISMNLRVDLLIPKIKTKSMQYLAYIYNVLVHEQSIKYATLNYISFSSGRSVENNENIFFERSSLEKTC